MDSSYTRVDDLWFPDGSLVIRAQDKGFRIFGSLLAIMMQSRVFRDILALPQASQGGIGETIDNTPSVFIDDPAIDVEVFLRAICNSSYFRPAPARVDPHALLGILRLSHKYDVRYLHQRALGHLECHFYFPPLDDYCAADDESDSNTWVPVIKAARDVGATWLLPCVYYRLASVYKPDMLLSDTDTDNLLRVHKGRTLLVREFTLNVAFLLAPLSGCTLVACTEARIGSLDVCVQWMLADFDVDPLGTRTLFDDSVKEFCPSCLCHAKDMLTENLRETWEKLPEIFGLPAWDDLKALRNKIMSEEE
ncbi:hypothetical protein B0H15DRAFT_863240 [Mycena belliarum]|uniref:BTB domain-containing protein n=1 Tax=Mycena belliarum TaxID=1033014 RepID=A0AAD6TSJ5_9AGAR|nr:hypothetical protein B0H15DRAFT_863240 [Mycena belliae]